MEIWIGREKGINYLFYLSGYSGGLTLLLDGPGKPIVTSVSKK